MSSTFDTMQQALQWLKGRVAADDRQAHDVLHYLGQIIERLHDHHHNVDPSLNAVAGRAVDMLATALDHPDDKEREMWLRVKSRD